MATWTEYGYIVAVVELLFYVFLWIRWTRWQCPLNFFRGDFPKKARPPADIIKMVEHHMCRSRKDAETFLADWHFGASTKTMSREDVEEFLSWSFFFRRRQELTDDELSLLTKCLARVEKKTGLSWGSEQAPLSGHSYSAQKFAAHTWETQCSYHHFPLVFYLICFIFKRLIGTPCLLLLGFRYSRQGSLGYWTRHLDCTCVRRSRPQAGPQEALLFFHGICPGLVTYLQFLMRFRHQTVILFELPWVTFNPLCTTVPSVDDFCNDVADALDAQRIARVCLSGHSYGSFMVAWLLRHPRMAGRVARVVLVSAPALNLFIVKTCKVVCYDKPFWFDYCLAHIFFRQFHWHECVLTAADLPKGSTVVLCEHDELVPIADVVRDCEENGVRCFVIPQHRHAWEIINPIACARVVKFIREGRGEPLRPKDDKGVGLFFHTARSSERWTKLYNLFYGLIDAIMSLFITTGHSPFDLSMLSYLDDLWPGGRKSPSVDNLQSLSGESSPASRFGFGDDEDKEE